MAVIHHTPSRRDHFTILANDVLRDDRLSFRARGILALLCSFSDGFHVTARILVTMATEGRDAVLTALRELELCGYLRRPRMQDEDGHWLTLWEVYPDGNAPSPNGTGEPLDDLDEDENEPESYPQAPSTGFQDPVPPPSPEKPDPVSQDLREEPEREETTVTTLLPIVTAVDARESDDETTRRIAPEPTAQAPGLDALADDPDLALYVEQALHDLPPNLLRPGPGSPGRRLLADLRDREWHASEIAHSIRVSLSIGYLRTLTPVREHLESLIHVPPPHTSRLDVGPYCGKCDPLSRRVYPPENLREGDELDDVDRSYDCPDCSPGWRLREWRQRHAPLSLPQLVGAAS